MNVEEARLPLLRSARRLRGGLAILLAVVLLGILGTGLAASLPGPGLAAFVSLPGGVEAMALAPWQRATVAAVAAGQLACAGFAVLALHTLLGGLVGPEAVGPGVPEAAGRTGRWLWITLAWSVLAQPVSSLAATWALPPGERMIAVEFGTTQLVLVLAVLVAAVLARALRLTAALWQDHREIV